MTTAQPAAGTALPSTTLTTGLVFARSEADLAAGTLLAGAATIATSGYTDSTTYGTDADGRYKVALTGNGQHWNALSVTGPEMTILHIVKRTGASGMLSAYDPNTPRTYILQSNSSNVVATLFRSDNSLAGTADSGTTAIKTASPSAVIMLARNTGSGNYIGRVSVDGVAGTDLAYGGTPNTINGQLDLLNRNGSINSNDKLYFTAIWNRALTDLELASLGANPWAIFDAVVVDTTPPVLSAPVGTATGSNSATVGATTDEGNGTLYVVVTTTSTQPSVTQIKAGQDSAGAAGTYSASLAVGSVGAKTFAPSSLAGTTGYYAHLVQTDLSGNNSNRVSSALFTTSAPSDVTAPTLTSPTGTKTGTTTASGTVTTNEGNGTLYRLASANTTESVATVKAAALTTTVTATGLQNVSFTGLPPGTVLYPHYVHRDAAGNDSARVTGASFTTDSVSGGGTILTPVVSNWGGSIIPDSTGWTAFVLNATTMAVVVTKTGQAIVSSVMTFTDPALSAGTTYVVILAHATHGVGALNIAAT